MRIGMSPLWYVVWLTVVRNDEACEPEGDRSGAQATSSEHAPWFVIPADRKWYRNLVVAQIVIAAMRGMEMKFPPVNFDPNEIEIE